MADAMIAAGAIGTPATPISAAAFLGSGVKLAPDRFLFTDRFIIAAANWASLALGSQSPEPNR